MGPSSRSDKNNTSNSKATISRSDRNSTSNSNATSSRRYTSLVQLVNTDLCDRDINNDELEAYKEIFFDNLLIGNSFAIKLDKVKVKAYDLWIKCLEYQHSSGRRKADKRNAVVKKFVKKDNVFRLSVRERYALVRSGISHVKEAAFGEFKTEFVEFVKDAARRRRKIQSAPKQKKKIDPPTESKQIKKDEQQRILDSPFYEYISILRIISTLIL